MLANAFQYAREQRLAVVAPNFPNPEDLKSLVNSNVLRRFIASLANQSRDVLFIITTDSESANALSRRMKFNKIIEL
ncbi:hypothetical protein [Levilactobacillus sp. HBUAS67488]|uniref:hypothetical protein n=1 Tax=Levilactobacillus sp. HBUAS67488 TaxID=3109361 RepID=UPI002FF0C7C4